jgi:hypothetical protein
MVTSLFVPIGLITYGWTAEKHVFWLVPDIGIGMFAFGKHAHLPRLPTAHDMHSIVRYCPAHAAIIIFHNIRSDWGLHFNTDLPD